MTTKRITFPREEWKSINSRLEEKGNVYTTRVDRDTDYAVGDELEAKLGRKRRKLVVSSAKNFTDLEKHPFHRHLTPKQLNILGRYDHYRLLKLKCLAGNSPPKKASLEPTTMTDSMEPSDARNVIAADRLGGAVLMGGAGALGGGLLGAKTMLDKTFEDYKADRLAWSQRKQRARERGEDTRAIDKERPGWVLPYLKAALKGGVVGGTLGGLGGGGLGALTGPSLMQSAARSASKKHKTRMREKIEQMRTNSPAEKTSSVANPVVFDCFTYVRNLYHKEAGLRNTMSGAVSSVKSSLQNKDVVKKLLRATILGAGGAVAGGAAGSLLKTKGITYDQYGKPKRKNRAGMGALLGGGSGVALGLLADPKQAFPLE